MDIKRFFRRSNEVSQEILHESEPVVFASYGLIGAILVLGALGYLLDKWLDSTPWLVILGIGMGLVLGFYGLVASVRRD